MMYMRVIFCLSLVLSPELVSDSKANIFSEVYPKISFITPPKFEVLPHRFRRDTPVTDPECGFHCGNTSSCIHIDEVCDGHVDCEDGSDEANSCERFRCPGYTYRCDYGACIGKRFVCNGKEECRDGSDEKECTADTSNDVGGCTKTEFRCSDDQCIDMDGKCDGKPDCLDKSDETSELCSKTFCPGYTFRCKYGACVSRRFKCNGKEECMDGSDEDPVLCGTGAIMTTTESLPPPVDVTKVPPTSGSCKMPEHPAHGKLIVPTNPTLLLKPGEYVAESTIMMEQCNKGFAFSDGKPNIILCLSGTWTRAIGQCIKTCDPMQNTTTMTVWCTRNGAPVDCSEPIHNTVASFRCAPYYEDLSLQRLPNRACRDGSWDQHAPNCIPACGKKNVKATTLIIGGQKAKEGDYPWQVALYELKDGAPEHICGGSLINQKVVLTAAHCVTSPNGERKSKDLYSVGVGKYYRTFNHPNDTDAQYSKVKDIYMPDEYRAYVLKYQADVAVLVAETMFQLSNRVLPVCIDWGENYDSQLYETGSKGVVTGWGYTEQAGNPSNELKEITVPYIVETMCKSTLPFEFIDYLTPDKMCSGFLNEGKGVCKGDSGGGLVFLNKLDNRYYVRGIVSLSPQKDDSCDPNQYALYTKVSKYITFISKYFRGGG